MAEVQVKKISWWMERLCDWMIAHPEKRLKDAAKEFGVTQAWLSVVKNSDVFKELFAKRSEQLSLGVVETVRDKLTAGTEMALDHLNKKIELEGEFLPIKDLMDVVDLGLNRLGYGANKSMPAPVSVVAQNVLITQGDLAAARQKVMEASGVSHKQINQDITLLEPITDVA
jgi:hypothetical protein